MILGAENIAAGPLNLEIKIFFTTILYNGCKYYYLCELKFLKKMCTIHTIANIFCKNVIPNFIECYI